jgi:signal transduction histidine kinase
MSHEMRTPMNAIIGMTDIAQASAEPEKMKYCLAKIGDASKHLLGVINDVLDMSKIEAGKLELSETNFTVTSLLRQVETVTAYKIKEKHQRFTVEVDDGVPLDLVADRQRLAQVITNLLGNANKFTPDGGDIAPRLQRLPNEKNLSCSASKCGTAVSVFLRNSRPGFFNPLNRRTAAFPENTAEPASDSPFPKESSR